MNDVPHLGKEPDGSQPEQPHPYQPYQPAQSPYGLSPYGVPWGPPPDHPSATTALILGILGLVLCQLVSPFAWVIGGRAVREIDASQGRQGGRSSAQAGRVCGIVGTAILAVYVVLAVALVALAFASPESFDESSALLQPRTPAPTP